MATVVAAQYRASPSRMHGNNNQITIPAVMKIFFVSNLQTLTHICIKVGLAFIPNEEISCL